MLHKVSHETLFPEWVNIRQLTSTRTLTNERIYFFNKNENCQEYNLKNPVGLGGCTIQIGDYSRPVEVRILEHLLTKHSPTDDHIKSWDYIIIDYIDIYEYEDDNEEEEKEE